jgi:hypothetical protein
VGKEADKFSNLKVHARTHTPKKPSPCQLCENQYRNDCQLKGHMECPHHCNICRKQVTTNHRIQHHKNCSHVDGSQLLPPLQLRPEFGETADKVASGKELTEAMSSVLLEGIMCYLIALFTHYAKAVQETMVHEYHNAMREFKQGMLVLAPLAKLFSTLLLTFFAQAHPSSTRYIKVTKYGYLGRMNNSYVRLGGKMFDNGPISMVFFKKINFVIFYHIIMLLHVLSFSFGFVITKNYISSLPPVNPPPPLITPDCGLSPPHQKAR